MRSSPTPSIVALTTLVVFGLLGGCEANLDPLAAIQQRGELRFITRNGPTTYFLGREGEQGFDFDLARAFAAELDVDLVVIEAFTLEELFAALERGEADIAGAALTRTDARVERYPASVGYAEQKPVLVYRTGRARPIDLGDLEDRSLAVIAGSDHEALLDDLTRQGLADLSWNAIETNDTFELLRRVDRGSVDFALVDSRDFALQQNLLPRLDIAFDLAAERPIVWYLAPRARDSSLLDAVNTFFIEAREAGQLAELRTRYFVKDDEITRVDTQTFVGRMHRDLRDYQQLIQIVGREQNLPWEFLAAMSYQESHWDPNATSRTGVRGMMMLTQATADDLGVRDRTDPGESMRGGARYFNELRERLPDDILEPDRTWFALAAYNIGRGHLEDARILTERRGKDPHLWDDVMDTLPLLENPDYYNTVRYGYARGQEAVRYVQNIRHYYQVLRLQSARDAAPQPPEDVQALLPKALRGLHLLAL